jgi:ribosome biogenesis GTPase
MEGIIIAATGGKYVVYSNGITYNVFPKGVFRYKKLNLLVGDKVTFDDETFTIVSTSVRSNELIRPKCANIDQIFVVMSVKQPELSIELIYKFLTYVNMNGITSKVVLTKIDLEDNFNEINTLKEDLEKLGIEVYLVSPFEKETILSLKEQFKNKVSILMGQTGVGKSTLINAIDPSFERKVGEYSDALGRGKHQTKEVLLLPYEGGFIGDTPGFSSLDLGIYKEDLAQFFPGYNQYYTSCFYSNCLHQKEKDCEVKAHIESGELSKEAYDIYLKLLNELPYKKERYNL